MGMMAKLVATWMAIGLAGAAQAVHLDIGGRGQVLLYPYYTVNNSQQTLVSVTNTSSVAQAVKVRFNEGYNGRYVLNFNVFLSPFDSWTGTVFALRDAGINNDGAAILTRDTSCTAPLFSEDGTSVNGTPYVAFRDFGYFFADDGGPTSIDRTREGSIEIFAMSNIDAPLSAAIAHGSNGSPPTGCAQVRNLLGTEPELSSAPSGGLMGSVSIINGGQGTYLSARAEALAGFTGVPLFTQTASIFPNLSFANDGAGSGLINRATARIFDANGKAQTLTYPGPDSRSRRVDAVSAVLMADRIYNEYQISANLGAASDWLVTFPTKPFYTDPAIITTPGAFAIPPFTRAYNGQSSADPRFAATFFASTFYSPNGQFTVSPGFGGDPADARRRFGLVVNVIPIYLDVPLQPSSVLGSQLTNVPSYPSYLPGPRYPFPGRPETDSGTLAINLNSVVETHQLLPSAEGKILRGLPIIGFWASNIVNANVSNGVLANYAAAVRHATSVTCVKASDGTPCD